MRIFGIMELMGAIGIIGVIGIIVRNNRDINGNRHNREGYSIRSIIPMGDEGKPCSRDIQGIIRIIEIIENTADRMSKKTHLIADINRSIRFHKRANDPDAACCCCMVQRLFPIL